MQILGRPFDQIDLRFLQGLADNRTPESVTHDYKSQLPDRRNDADKRRIVQVLAAFANTQGGVLVFGFDQENWTVPGLKVFDPDRDCLQLNQVFRRSIQPGPPSLRYRVLLEAGRSPILLAGIPSSVARPHGVLIDDRWAFVGRNDRGNFNMDVAELRRAFAEGAQWAREIQEFRLARLEQARRTPGLPTELLLIHVLPVGRLDSRIELFTTQVRPGHYLDTGNGGDQQLPNLDGWQASTSRADACCRYVQVFRNGGVEVCWSVESMIWQPSPAPLIDGWAVDQRVVEALTKSLKWLVGRGIDPPIAILLTATNVHGMRLGKDPYIPVPTRGQFDRPVIQIPPLFLEQIQNSGIAEDDVAIAENAANQMLDVLWQAAGEPRSPNFEGGRLRRKPGY